MALIVAARESLLSTSSGYTNYRGILNLCVILLVLSNARAALENIIKYGILVDPISWLTFIIDSPKHWPAIEICLVANASVLASLAIEKLIAGQVWPVWGPVKANWQAVSSTLIGLNLVTLLFAPPWMVFISDSHPVSTSLALTFVSCTFLKLTSYHSINFWCRDVTRPPSEQSSSTRAFLKSYCKPADQLAKSQRMQQRHREASSTAASEQKAPTGEPPANTNGHGAPLAPTYCQDAAVKELYNVSEPYPKNLTLRNLCYFMVAPTLCYELEFARTPRIRKRFLLKRTIELIVLLQLDLALVQQWLVPTVNNSLVPFREMQLTHMLERLLKLAVPNHVIWHIWFYLFFHSWLNIQAELTRFADREFYQDWWNSESVGYFWRNWNIPVHKWCARHLYVPLLSFGCTRFQASAAVFLVSAFFHEYLVSVPLKLFRLWAFFGMLMQLPLSFIVSTYFNHQFANVAVWITLILGQPLCILMYYHDYYVMNRV